MFPNHFNFLHSLRNWVRQNLKVIGGFLRQSIDSFGYLLLMIYLDLQRKNEWCRKNEKSVLWGKKHSHLFSLPASFSYSFLSSYWLFFRPNRYFTPVQYHSFTELNKWNKFLDPHSENMIPLKHICWLLSSFTVKKFKENIMMFIIQTLCI